MAFFYLKKFRSGFIPGLLMSRGREKAPDIDGETTIGLWPGLSVEMTSERNSSGFALEPLGEFPKPGRSMAKTRLPKTANV